MVTARPHYMHDELRYVEHADRIAQGKWTNHDDGTIENGPLFPLLLGGLKRVGLPYAAARIVNAVLLLSSLVILYRTFIMMALSRKWSLCGVAAIGLYIPILKDMTFIHTEALSFFLICGFSYFFLDSCRRERWRGSALAAAVLLAALCMNRVFFGWVLLAGLVCVLCFLPFNAARAKAIRAVAILSLAFVLCVPYLSFTFSVTGKVLCWSTNGGELMYWMASPYEEEYGNWFSSRDVSANPDLERNHGEVFRTATTMSAAEQQEYFLSLSRQNMRQSPLAYAKNWVWNISRLLYNRPRSYVNEDPKFLLYVFPHTLILFLLAGSLPIFWRYRTTIPLELYWLMGFALIYLGGISLLPATPRSLAIILPVLSIWMIYLFGRHLKISLVPVARK